MLKNWWQFTKPDKRKFAFYFFLAVVHRVCLVLGPFLAAMAISNLAEGNIEMAMIFLSLEFAQLVFRNIVADQMYRRFTSLRKDPYCRLQQNIITKTLRAKKENFKAVSEEQILNTIHADVNEVTRFLDTISLKVADLVRLLITVGAVIFLNPYVALVIVGATIINFFIGNKLFSNFAAVQGKVKSAIDNQYKALTNILNAKDKISFDETRDALEKSFGETSGQYIKFDHKRNKIDSHIRTWFFVFYMGIVFAISIALVFLIGQDSLTFAEYLIIIPYVTTGIVGATDFMEVFRSLKEVNVFVNRVKTVLSFSEKENIDGTYEQDYIFGGINFLDVTYENEECDGDENKPPVYNLTFSIAPNTTTVIHGSNADGRISVFRMLKRELKPTSGNILLGDLDIYDYKRSNYIKNINVVTSDSFMLRDSVIRNLKILGNTREDVDEICNELDIHDRILELKNGYDTHIDDVPSDLKYLIVLARVCLAKCDTLLFYDITNKMERSIVVKAIKKLKGKKTMVVFAPSRTAAITKPGVCDKVIELKDGLMVSEETIEDIQTIKAREEEERVEQIRMEELIARLVEEINEKVQENEESEKSLPSE